MLISRAAFGVLVSSLMCACQSRGTPPAPSSHDAPEAAAAADAGAVQVSKPTNAIATARISIPVGKGIVAADGTTRIEFVDVVEDSRCPVEAKCITAGWARIRAYVKRTTEPVTIETLSLAGSQLEAPPDRSQHPGGEKTQVDLGDRVVHFVKLAPMPVNRDRQRVAPNKADYVATFLIEPK